MSNQFKQSTTTIIDALSFSVMFKKHFKTIIMYVQSYNLDLLHRCNIEKQFTPSGCSGQMGGAFYTNESFLILVDFFVCLLWQKRWQRCSIYDALYRCPTVNQINSIYIGLNHNHIASMAFTALIIYHLIIYFFNLFIFIYQFAEQHL